jgi:hypothetical protein
MGDRAEFYGPVAVGGLGGSGTRVVAEILMSLGFYVGSTLTKAHDNLWFTLLFKRPQWFMRSSNTREPQLFKGFRIFEKVMTGQPVLRTDELTFIVRATIGRKYFSKPHYLRKYRRACRAAISMLRSNRPDFSKYVGWGWKEPNTHIFIEYLVKYYGQRIKYIHVIRHGLDMAYSKNQNQLYNWGHLFGVQIPASPQLLPKASLSYWIKANEKAIALGKRHLGDRFLLVNFDELCSARDREAKRLAEFAGMGALNVNMKQLYSIPRRPSSMGRYKQHDLSIFDQGEIDAVRRLGFELDV